MPQEVYCHSAFIKENQQLALVCLHGPGQLSALTQELHPQHNALKRTSSCVAGCVDDLPGDGVPLYAQV